jgi:hypothetical protein
MGFMQCPNKTRIDDTIEHVLYTIKMYKAVGEPSTKEGAKYVNFSQDENNIAYMPEDAVNQVERLLGGEWSIDDEYYEGGKYVVAMEILPKRSKNR